MPRYENMRSIMDPDYKKVSPLESEIRGAAQELTMGGADEIGGAAGAVKDMISGGDESGVVESYKRNRDASRSQYENAQQDNPEMYKVGQAMGLGGSLLVPGLGALKGAKGAAAFGAMSGLGHSNADLTEGEVGQAAIDAGKGAAIGTAGGVALEKLVPRFSGLMEKLGGKKPPSSAPAQVAKEGSVPLSKYVSEDDLRKIINPDLAELQMTGKASPKLRESAANIDSQLQAAARVEKIKRNAEDVGLSVDDYLKSSSSADDATKTITDLINKKKAG